MKNSGIVTTKELLPFEFCDEIIQLFDTTLSSDPVEGGFIQDSLGNSNLYRRDKFMCFDEVCGSQSLNYSQVINDHLTRALAEYIDMFPVLNGVNTSLFSVRQKLQKTPISGGFHGWHCENSHIETLHRVLAWTIYLNDVDEGGETEFLYQSERVKAKKGKTSIFPAGFMHTHRGNPPISNEKYILTGWFSLRMRDNFYGL
tara:strand:+ start:512 stop:1114 length:603 start_codon:yes stop_codon:yes gene_type:complete